MTAEEFAAALALTLPDCAVNALVDERGRGLVRVVWNGVMCTAEPETDVEAAAREISEALGRIRATGPAMT